MYCWSAVNRGQAKVNRLNYCHNELLASCKQRLSRVNRLNYSPNELLASCKQRLSRHQIG